MKGIRWLAAGLLMAFPALLFSGAGAQAVQNESGFIRIDPVNFYFHYNSYSSRLDLRSSEAQIWHSFLAADHEGDKTPIFVFFNGGPGSASSCGLMSMYTGRYTLDNSIESGGGDHYLPNPVSWTRLGHLLYIDARETGFSYNNMSNPSDIMSRFREFNAQNFNPFFDAADFIRVLLRFLAAHPSLQNHPVVIVGESYGGERATAMLYLLLNYPDLANDREMYQDPALAREIQSHFDKVFPEYAGRVVPPQVISRQFGHQVLIEPCISFGYQDEIQTQILKKPGSVVYKIAEEVGIPYDSQMDPLYYVNYVAKRDYYMYVKPAGWLNGFFGNAANLLRFTQNLSLVTGSDVRTISGLYAKNRPNAYRVVSLNTAAALQASGNDSRGNSIVSKALFLDSRLMEADLTSVEPGDLSAVFGALQSWDRYFMSSNGMANSAFHFYNIALIRGYEVYYLDHRFGRMFLKNLLQVNTFVTDAAYDLVVYGPAIPPSLAKHEDIAQTVETEPGASDRSRQIVVKYKSDAFPDIPNPGTRAIRFPYYDKSCHAVSLTQPVELFEDVSLWLQEKGLALTWGVKR